MYSVGNSNSGRTRVNKYFLNQGNRSSKKNRKEYNIKPDNRKSLDKLKDLQKELFSEGYTLGDYKEEVQEKIDDNKLHYRGLSDKNVNELHDLFSQKLKREDERFNLIDDKHDLKVKQSILFKEKKQRIVTEKRRELIEQLFKELKQCKSLGVTRSDIGLSSDPDNWVNNKKFLFLGGRLEGSDKEWCKTYYKLTNNDMILFGFIDKKEFHNYIRNY